MKKSSSLLPEIFKAALSHNWVPLYYSLNLFLSGFLFPDSYLIPGYSDHFYDFVIATTGALTLLIIGIRFQKRANSTIKIAASLYILLGALAATIANLSLPYLLNHGEIPQKIIDGWLLTFTSALGQIFSFTILVGTFTYARQATQLVQERRNALNYAREQIAIRISEGKEALISQIEAAIKPALAGLTELKGEKDQISQEIFQVIDSVVRPLSHEIDAKSSVDNGFQFGNSQIKSKRIALFKRINMEMPLSNAVNPFLSITTYVVFPIVSLVYLIDSTVLTKVALPFILITSTLLVLFKKLAQNIQIKSPLVLLVSILISALFTLSFDYLAGAADYSPDIYQSVSVSVFLLTFFPGFLEVLIHTIKVNLDDAEQLNTELAKSSAQIRQQLWRLNKRIARELHGGLQSKLQVAALAIQSGKAEESAALSSIYMDFSSSLEESLNVKPALSIEESLSNLAEFWDGVASIKSDIDQVSASIINKDVVLSECLLEVSREAINNAVKHATSTDIEISLSSLDDQVLLTVKNNVNKAKNNQSSSTSLGQKIYKELSTSWKLNIGDNQSIFEATFSFR